MKSRRSFSLTLAILERSLENGTMILYHFVLVNVTLVSTLSAVFLCAAEHVKRRFWNVILGNINYYIIMKRPQFNTDASI